MASPQAILRAARAVPGGARPTLPPQGSTPYAGAFSPMAMQMASEPGYASSYRYGPFLPRPPRDFTQGAFAPFSPILPVPVDEPPPGAELPDPRRFEYVPGWNMPVGQPGSEGIKLASFGTLRTLADLYSIARTCVERRKNEISGLDWDIVPTHEASKAYQGDHSAMRDFGERRAQAVKFFRRPDPEYFTFASWLKAMLEEIFVFDALSLILKPKRGKGAKKGLLGSDLDCIELVNGATMRPLLDLHGATPRPPAPAFQQYLYGVPRSDFMTMVTGDDIQQAGLEGFQLGKFSTDQMLYLPLTKRTWTPYGFSCVEQALIVIMTGLQKQAYQLDYYREGTVPAVYISPGDMNITPNQIRELQDALNAYAGDPAWHHKIIVLPPGARVEPQRAQDLADQFDEYLANEVAMVFDVDPMSLGLIPKVSTVASPFAAREMAQASRTVHERTSTKPLLKFLADIFNAILHRVCGQDDMKFTFAGLDEAADQAATTDLLVKQVQNGIRSVDEARGELELPPWGLPETSGPVVFTQMGPMPFEWMPGAGLQQAEGQPYSGETSSPQSEVAGEAQGATGKPTGMHHPPSSRPVGTHNPRLGLPTGGSNLRGEVPPERGGRRTGNTPAHSAAVAHMGQSAARGRSKAAAAEMEMLARHLRKGRDITTWRARFVPAVTLAMVAEDLTKGLSPEEAVRNAVITLPPGSYEWVAKDDDGGPKAWPGWERDQRLTRVYGTRIAEAFRKALKRAATLIRRWWSGVLAVTVRELTRLIAELIAKALRKVLRALWREAWHLGSRSAQAVVEDSPVDWGAWNPGDRRTLGVAYPRDLEAWIASHGRDVIEGMADTRMDTLAEAIQYAVAEGDGAASIIERLAAILMVTQRSDLTAETEVQRAQSAAARLVYLHAGVATKKWLTEGDSKVCARCLANAAQGPIPFAEPFQDGSLWPPGHGRCRCAGVPGDKDIDVVKGRTVDLNGQEWWPAGSYQHGYAMGQGALGRPVPHDGHGGYRPGGVPGATAGGDPPRWDGDETEHAVSFSEPSDSEGRGDTRTRGGGTMPVLEDRSEGTHASHPDVSDPAELLGSPGIPPRPGTYFPAGYMDGYWPRGGHGTGQSPMASAGGDARGRAPNAHGKAASVSGKPVSADVVHRQLEGNYPDSAIAWVKDATWVLTEVPQEKVDYQDERKWAAAHQEHRVHHFARLLAENPSQVDPVVMVAEHGDPLIKVIDGHHRTLGAKQNGQPARAYVGAVPEGDKRWEETHSSQVHQGSDPANKAAKVSKASVNYRHSRGGHRCGNCVMFRPSHGEHGMCTKVEGDIEAADVCDLWYPRDAGKAARLALAATPANSGESGEVRLSPRVDDADGVAGAPRPGLRRSEDFCRKGHSASVPPVAAGLAVRAADTGRILMLQRAHDEDDPAGGFWEMPGGCLDDGEDALEAARREWAEETGVGVPDGELTGVWNASNGKYRGFVYTVPSEDAVDIFGDRDEVTNPDDPDGDHVEALAWWEPKQLRDNPAVRPELADDLKRVRRALKSAQTPIVSTVHHPLGHEGLWHTPDRHVATMQQLPAYFQNTARALMRDQGMGEQQAIATAINAVKEWAEGRAFGGKVKVTPEVQAAARRALEEWERLRASHH